jgi:hypothetical protein
MPRRTYHNTRKGQLFASEWPEWHVDCAAEGCGEHLLVAALGEAMTAREAEKCLKSRDTPDESKGWTRRGGLWYCPDHS